MNKSTAGNLQERDISQLLQQAASDLHSHTPLSLRTALQAIRLAVAQNDNRNAGEAALLAGKAEYISHNKGVALRYFEQACEYAQTAVDDKTCAAAWNNIGLIRFENTDWKEAENAYNHSLHLKEKNGDEKGIAISCLNLGAVYYKLGRLPEALHYYVRARKIFEKSGDRDNLAKAIYNCGYIYNSDQDFEEALQCFMTALDLTRESNDYISLINIYICLGNVKRLLGHYDESEHYLQLSLQMSRDRGYNDGTAASLSNLCELFFYTGNHEKAIYYGKAVIEFSSERSHQYYLALAHFNLGRVYFAENRLDESETELKKALEIAQSLESKHRLPEILLALAVLSEKQGDYKQALYYQREHQELKDNLHNLHVDRKLAELKFQNAIEQQQKEAEMERLHNVELKKEKELSDSLLKNILPDDVAEELKSTGSTQARAFENVTVLFTDFVAFSKAAERLNAQQLVNELDTCFKAFDNIIGQCNIEKIKTIGDAYMAAAGLPDANPNHAEDVLNAAIKIRDFMEQRRNVMGEDTFRLRLGIHSGPVIAGVVGLKKFAYDIWGDTVNIAARMEQYGETGKINISEATYQLVKHKYACTYRGEIEAKNKGLLKMYFVEEEL